MHLLLEPLHSGLDPHDLLSPDPGRGAHGSAGGLGGDVAGAVGLLRFAGILDEDAACQLGRTIEAGCEQVGPDSW